MRSLVRGREEDEADPFELAAALLGMMEDLAQDCEALSSTLMSSLADIPMAQSSNAELCCCFRTEVPLEFPM